jgi:hypothetical protein
VLADDVPPRQVRAAHDDATVVVYQAYSSAIADPALAAGTFVAPFRRERMTWIKPSFLWMMYRCGWASKPGQERVLAVTITREGFEWALAHACLSDFDPAVYADHEAWEERMRSTPVRVQWDPERSLTLERLDHRSIQIGLRGAAVERYVADWIVGLQDITPLVHEMRGYLEVGALEAVQWLLPQETALVLPAGVAAVIAAS